jgi:hypothetical protein
MKFTYPSGSRPLDGYTVKRGVGRGGFGEVYFATSDAGKEVALKLIRRNLEVELRGVTQCLNLKHPNLIALYDIRTDEHEDRWVVMEYVAGESLEDAIGRHPQGMPRDLAFQWFEGIASAVAYLHDHGIVHRDLKPANIFIDEGAIKIGDYGLSKFISCSRRSGQTESVGTVHYMAPEIANGRYGREIDAYALGIILYEMLTGHVPFEGESVGEVLMKHLTAEPDLSALEEPFRAVVQAAMAKDPERRINNAAHMVSMLRGEALATFASGARTANGLPPAEAAPRAGSYEASAPQVRPSAPYGAPRPGSRPRPTGGRTVLEFFHADPEPILTGLVMGWRGMVRELNFQSWPAARRFFFSVFCIVCLIFTFPFWFVLALSLGAAYLAYFVVRLVVIATTKVPEPVVERAAASLASFGAGPAAAGPKPASADAGSVSASLPTAAYPAPPQQRPWRRRAQPNWRQAAYQQLAARTVRERTSTLLGSMLAASVVAPVTALLACLFSASEFQPDLFLWTALVATLSSWALLLPAQLTEGRLEEHVPLRFSQLLAGALVGSFAWFVANSLFLSLPSNLNVHPLRPEDAFTGWFFGEQGHSLSQAYQAGTSLMPLPMFAAYFAFLFATVRWWRMAEWTRSSHVSLWAVAWCGFMGWAMTFFWWFPQPTGLLLAATIAFTVQLSSPWLPPRRRKELAQAVA